MGHINQTLGYGYARPPIDELEMFLDEKGSTNFRVPDSTVTQLLRYIRLLEKRIRDKEG